MSLKDNIEALFAPKIVAVIGASAVPGKVGYTVVANMQIRGGFEREGTTFEVRHVAEYLAARLKHKK